MVCKALRIHLQRHTKCFRYIKVYGEKFLKRFQHITLSVMKLTCHLDIQKNFPFEKLLKYDIFFVCRFIQKFSNALRSMGGGIFNRILTNVNCTKCNKASIFFKMYNCMFHIQDHA